MKNALITILVIALLALGIYTFLSKNAEPSVGAIITGQEYSVTTTDSVLGIKADGLIKGGWGSLGSIVVTSAGTTAYRLYDATSTNAVLTDTRFNASDSLIASVPASLAAGTYVFDATYTKGLVIDMIVNGTASTTISYR